MSRVIVALNPPRRIGDWIVYARFVADCLARVPIFVSPVPSLAVFEAHIAELEAAQVLAYKGPAGRAGGAGRQAVHRARRSHFFADVRPEPGQPATLRGRGGHRDERRNEREERIRAFEARLRGEAGQGLGHGAPL